MRFGWIAVIAMAVMGFWIHEKRAAQPASQSVNPVHQAMGTTGTWQPYPAQGAAATQAGGRVRLNGLRVIAPQSGFQAQVGPQALEGHIRRVEKHAFETLSHAKQGTVLVRFINSPGRQEVQLTSQGQIDGKPLQAFQSRLAAMEQLTVRSGGVVFELRVAVAP